MKITPTPITAALAGAFGGIVMPMLWSRLSADSMILVLAFLLVVALPAHAFVVGFGRNQTADPRTVDTALLKRVGAWLAVAVVAAGISHVLRAQA
jgi:glycopeptide antibiotics resistance protein